MNAVIAEQLSQGVDLLILGMGTVFLFLALLVFSVRTMSRFSAWVASKNPPPPEPKSGGGAAPVGSLPMAVIAAAVHRYRQDHPS